MKNKMSDVRNHLVAMLEKLGDDDVSPQTIEAAKTTALVADKYIAAVKCEIEALRLADDIGRLPVAIEAAPIVERETQRVLSAPFGKAA